jgi:hypothetical protein
MRDRLLLLLVVSAAVVLVLAYIRNRDEITEKRFAIDCLNGVSYIEFPNGGVSVEYTADGKVKTCSEEIPSAQQ